VGRFDGRTAFVSGAGGGIGRASARLLAREGATVAVADMAAELARKTTELITAEGGTAQTYSVDVTSGHSVEEAVSRAEAELGPVTLAVTAAGVIRNSPFLELPVDDWDRTMAVNLRGTFLVLQSVARRAKEHGGGSMVAVSSVAGRGARATAADYAASKAGVISVVRSAAQALAEFAITVNAICPGVVDTEMTRAIHQTKARIEHITPRESFDKQAAQIPLGRIVSPAEVAETVVYLLSPAATYITGQAVNVCGGLEMD